MGSYLVPRLLARGHDVRVLSRRPAPTVPAGATAVRGDVRAGVGLDVAAAGTDAVIHAATSPNRRVKATEVAGTRNILAVARAAGAHLIYVSIVGVDRNRFPYYKAKWAAEQVVEASDGRWTILRATQFHDLLDRFFRGRILPMPRATPFQPVHAGDVADRLVDMVEAGPGGRVIDIGGPQVRTIKDLNESRARITGKKALLLPVPKVGFVRDFVAGYHTCPDHAVGRVSWEDWLQTRAGAGG